MGGPPNGFGAQVHGFTDARFSCGSALQFFDLEWVPFRSTASQPEITRKAERHPPARTAALGELLRYPSMMTETHMEFGKVNCCGVSGLKDFALDKFWGEGMNGD